MYLWQKLAGRSWLASHETALRALAGDQLAIIDQSTRKRLQLEVASQSTRRLQILVNQFGGRIEKLPRDWLKRSFRQQKTKSLKIATKRLIIPAGAAFGTGEHATTALCLRLLGRGFEFWGAHAPRVLFSAPSPKSSLKVRDGEGVIARTRGRARSPEVAVDLGTGSGILALAASVLGAKRVIGIDNDPVAISTAKENARQNKIDNVQFRLADVRRWKPPSKIDIVTANLFSGLLLEILPKLRGVRLLILSGVLRDEEAEVARGLQQDKIDIIEVRHRGKWVAILAGQLRRS